MLYETLEDSVWSQGRELPIHSKVEVCPAERSTTGKKRTHEIPSPLPRIIDMIFQRLWRRTSATLSSFIYYYAGKLPDFIDGDTLPEVRGVRERSSGEQVLLAPSHCSSAQGVCKQRRGNHMAGAQGYCAKQEVDIRAILPIIQMLTQDAYVFRPALLVRAMQLLRAAAIPSRE